MMRRTVLNTGTCRADSTLHHMRFIARKATKGWMVWDNETDQVAVVDHYRAIGISAETAVRFADMLNKLNGQLETLKRQA
jgi:hypothetical protein